MIAIVSDIHGNLEALTAVLDDITQHGAEAIYCLGDLVGYGPNPGECVDLAMDFDVTLMGNHDEAMDTQAVLDPDDFGPEAQRFLDWTRQQVALPIQEAESRIRFLTALPREHRVGSTLLVHGGPADPVHQYIFPMDRHNEPKMKPIFCAIDRVCFHGHTHLPGVMTESLKFYRPHEITDSFELGQDKVLCNVGSVGLSRDNDPRATYVLFDGQRIQFQRIPFDSATTRRKLNELTDELAAI